jgi:D-lactate dehydrogenase
MDVYFYEAFEEEAEALKALLGSSFKFDLTLETIQESGHTAPPAPLISIRTQSLIPIDWSDKLKGVLSRSTGYDHLVRFRSQLARPIPCGYLDEYATRAIAEHAILLMLALMRKLPMQVRQFETFNRDGLTGVESAGKHLLVVGVGRIGSEVMKLGKGLGFEVRGVDIVRRHPDVTYVDPEDGLAWADSIVCAMNLTEVNHGYFSYDRLKRCKRGCVLVNIARGEQTPLSDLNRGLEEKVLGGLGLDVFEDEGNLADELRHPSGKNAKPEHRLLNRLAAFPNVLLTPHNAFNTTDAVARKSSMAVEQVRHFLTHGDFIWKL